MVQRLARGPFKVFQGNVDRALTLVVLQPVSPDAVRCSRTLNNAVTMQFCALRRRGAFACGNGLQPTSIVLKPKSPCPIPHKSALHSGRKGAGRAAYPYQVDSQAAKMRTPADNQLEGRHARPFLGHARFDSQTRAKDGSLWRKHIVHRSALVAWNTRYH